MAQRILFYVSLKPRFSPQTTSASACWIGVKVQSVPTRVSPRLICSTYGSAPLSVYASNCCTITTKTCLSDCWKGMPLSCATRCATSARMLVDVGRGTSNGHICRTESSVLNKKVKERVVMMCRGKMFPAVVTCLSGVSRWDEHKKLLCISNY